MSNRKSQSQGAERNLFGEDLTLEFELRKELIDQYTKETGLHQLEDKNLLARELTHRTAKYLVQKYGHLEKVPKYVVNNAKNTIFSVSSELAKVSKVNKNYSKIMAALKAEPLELAGLKHELDSLSVSVYEMPFRKDLILEGSDVVINHYLKQFLRKAGITEAELEIGEELMNNLITPEGDINYSKLREMEGLYNLREQSKQELARKVDERVNVLNTDFEFLKNFYRDAVSEAEAVSQNELVKDVVLETSEFGIDNVKESDSLSKLSKVYALEMYAAFARRYGNIEDLVNLDEPDIDKIKNAARVLKGLESKAKNELVQDLGEMDFVLLKSVHNDVVGETETFNWAGLVKAVLEDYVEMGADAFNESDDFAKLLNGYAYLKYDKIAERHGAIGELINLESLDIKGIKKASRVLKGIRTKAKSDLVKDLENFSKLYNNAIVMKSGGSSRDLYAIDNNDYFSGGLLYYAELMENAGTGSDKDPLAAKQRIFGAIRHNETGITDMIFGIFGRRKKLRDITIEDVVAAGNYEVANIVEKWERAPSDITGAANRIKSLGEGDALKDVLDAYSNGVKYQAWLDRVSKAVNRRGTSGEFDKLDRRFKEEMGGGRVYIDVVTDLLNTANASLAKFFKKDTAGYDIYSNPVIKAGISPSLGFAIALGVGGAIIADVWNDIEENYKKTGKDRKSFLGLCTDKIGKWVPEERIKLFAGISGSEKVPAFLAV